VEIRPFAEDDIDGAGALLATRHTRHRAAEPLLDARYASAEGATRAVADLWAVEGASGAVAASGGRLVGFLLGTPAPTAAWGPNAWVQAAGHAAVDAETVRDLYALAAARWVADGATAHYAVVPSHDAALVDAWFRLGFGQQQVHALREAPAPGAGAAASVRVRRAVPSDAPALAELDLTLPRHQVRAPVFSGRQPPSFADALAEERESIGDPDYATFVAELDGSVVGSAVGCSVEHSRMHSGPARPDAAGYLAFAAVLPGFRGRGVGRVRGETARSWTAEAGYRTAVTDWRATNLLSSRTWPRLGFRPSFLRLHRVVGY